MSNELKQELETYEKHKEDLLRSSMGKYVLIYKAEVCDTYNDQLDAIVEGYKKFGRVPFLVKEVLPYDRKVFFNRDVSTLRTKLDELIIGINPICPYCKVGMVPKTHDCSAGQFDYWECMCDEIIGARF